MLDVLCVTDTKRKYSKTTGIMANPATGRKLTQMTRLDNSFDSVVVSAKEVRGRYCKTMRLNKKKC